jgi:hypothetical protein
LLCKVGALGLRETEFLFRVDNVVVCIVFAAQSRRFRAGGSSWNSRVGLIMEYLYYEFSAQRRRFRVAQKGVLVWG